MLSKDAQDVRNIRWWDGLYYSFEVLTYYYQGLHELCCEITGDDSKIVPALASCWGFIDALHRIRKITQHLPINKRCQEVRAFNDATKLAKCYRNYIQHLNKELSKKSPNTFPVWGSLSWVDERQPERSHTAILGARSPGIKYSSCVYDTVNRKWASKVCLGWKQESFNFDPVYESSMRFREFVIPHLINIVSREVRSYNKLPIITVDAVPKTIHNNQLNNDDSR